MKLTTQSLPKKLNPWNWFKHEQSNEQGAQIPVTRAQSVAPWFDGGRDPFTQLHRAMDALFDDAFRSFGMPGLRTGFSSGPYAEGSNMAGLNAPLDVSGDDKQYHVTLDVPGLQEQDLHIEVSQGALTIRGEKEEQQTQQEQHYYRSERRYGSFQRTLNLPDDAAADDISAELKDGVLRLTIPRVALPASDAKRIEINAH